VKKISGLGHWEENLELWKIFGIFLEIFGRGGKWTTVYPHGGNGSPSKNVYIFQSALFH
jgi:hypothetical protein